MKILSIAIERIVYQPCAYDEELRQSLLRMGQGFPILIKKLDDTHYQCLDGHKRLSAIHDICDEVPNTKLFHVKAILENARTSSGTTKNHH